MKLEGEKLCILVQHYCFLPATIFLTVLEIIDSMTSAFHTDICRQEKHCGPFREAGRRTILGAGEGRTGSPVRVWIFESEDIWHRLDWIFLIIVSNNGP